MNLRHGHCHCREYVDTTIKGLVCPESHLRARFTAHLHTYLCSANKITAKMKTANIVSALILAGVSYAQTPEGFAPAVTDKLEVTFGTKNVATGGQALTKAETARQPTIGISGTADGTYLWMLIGKFAGHDDNPLFSFQGDVNDVMTDLDAYGSYASGILTLAHLMLTT